MAELRILVDMDVLTVDDLITLEDAKIRGLRDVLARLAVDDNDRPLPFEDAKALVGKLTVRQLNAQAEALGKMMREKAAPPVRGSG